MKWFSEQPHGCGFEKRGLSFEARLLGIVTAFFLFAVVFSLSWRIMEKRWARFMKMDVTTKADNCSRVNSTLHAILVSPSLLYGMYTMQWSRSLAPQHSPAFLQSVLALSAGYFLFDLYVVLRYQGKMWVVFLIHHVMAVVPYLIYFFGCCNNGLFILSGYMLVEITNIPYNAKLWMEECGRTGGVAYPALLYFTVVCWVVFRLLNPLWCLQSTYRTILPSFPFALCLIPSQICGVLVNIFCFAAFFTVLMKEVSSRWSSIPLRKR